MTWPIRCMPVPCSRERPVPGMNPGSKTDTLNALGRVTLELVGIVDQGELRVGVRDARSTVRRLDMRRRRLGDVDRVLPVGRRDAEQPPRSVEVVRVRAEQDDARRSGDRAEQVADELGVRQVVDCERELVPVR